MDGKAERALIAGTNNVYDIKRFKALKVIESYRGAHPNICDAWDFEDAPPAQWEHVDYLGHHKRMVEATNRIKARRDFIDGHSTDS